MIVGRGWKDDDECDGGYWRQKREEAHWMRKDTEEIGRIGACGWGRIGLDWQSRGLGCLLGSPKIEDGKVNNGEGGRDSCDVTPLAHPQTCSKSAALCVPLCVVRDSTPF